MKILIVSDQLLKIEGNNILGTVNFTNTLKRLSQLGELHVCVRDVSTLKTNILIYNDIVSNYLKIENISFISKSYIWPSLHTLKTMKNKIKEVDLVIGYLPSLNAEAASFLTHKIGKRYFAFMVACPWDGLWNQDWKRKIAAPYRYYLNKKVLRKADYALYVTNYFLQNRYPTLAQHSLGLSDVVLESLDDNILKKRLEKISNYSQSIIFKIATTAMLNVRYKGQRFVLEALKELKEKGINNFKYYLIGGGDPSDLKKLTMNLNIEDMVIFVGKITHEKVFELLDEMDIYIHPSLQEGLPRSVVEAMSRGLPCIGTNTGAIPELLDKDFIIRRKSVEDIVEKILLIINPAVMRNEAERNFMEAKKYNCTYLDGVRNNFFNKIITELESAGRPSNHN